MPSAGCQFHAQQPSTQASGGLEFVHAQVLSTPGQSGLLDYPPSTKDGPPLKDCASSVAPRRCFQSGPAATRATWVILPKPDRIVNRRTFQTPAGTSPPPLFPVYQVPFVHCWSNRPKTAF